MSDIMTVRITEQLKQNMAEFDLNWSEFIRTAIQQKILELKREQAFREMDRIKLKNKSKKLQMSDEVIKWRRRH